jgi:hypothetical protein
MSLQRMSVGYVSPTIRSGETQPLGGGGGGGGGGLHAKLLLTS